MRILFIGVFDFPWSTNIGMKKALLELGHKVDVLNYRTIADSYKKKWEIKCKYLNYIIDKILSSFRRIYFLEYLNTLFYTTNGRKELKNLILKKANNYNVVLIAKGDIVDYRIFNSIKAKVWYFFMDPISTGKKIGLYNFAKNSDGVSTTFSFINNKLLRMGINSYWIPQGIDPKNFYKKKMDMRTDVVFVGNKNKKRSRIVKKLLDNEIDVVCYGKGWENNPIYLNNLVEVYNSTKIVLNINQGNGFSVRVFQVMACGAFMLTEYCSDIKKIFKKEKHLDWFNSYDDLLWLVEYYLKNDTIRNNIAKNGHEYVHKNFTWKGVMEKIITKINLIKK